MLIGIDGNEANEENRVGVNQYGFELLCSIYKLQDEWKGDHSFVIYLRCPPRADMPKESANWRYKVIPGRLWIITKLMPDLFLSRPRPDIFFTPSHYVPPFAPMPRICSIMDLGYLEFSGQFRRRDFWQLKLWSAWSIKVSSKVIAISQSTKNDIVRHYPSAAKKIEVTQLGFDHKRFNTKIPTKDVRRIKERYGVDDYILFLSTLKPSKNIDGLLEASVKIMSRYSELSLVIAGKKGWLFESIFEKVKALGLEDKVIFTDFIPEDDKPALIKGAKLFALPSFWEGFGMDVLSAMASGVPVVVSNRGSLPEVVGNAGILVDPESVEDIANGMEKVLSMGRIEYNRLVKKQLTQAEKFSWEKTARKTISILESVK